MHATTSTNQPIYQQSTYSPFSENFCIIILFDTWHILFVSLTILCQHLRRSTNPTLIILILYCCIWSIWQFAQRSCALTLICTGFGGSSSHSFIRFVNSGPNGSSLNARCFSPYLSLLTRWFCFLFPSLRWLLVLSLLPQIFRPVLFSVISNFWLVSCRLDFM